MPLTAAQVSVLDMAMSSYAFPAVYCDFGAETQIVASTMFACEAAIRSQLVSPNPLNTKDGLANVIYWGNATAGYRDHRVAEFRAAVTSLQIAGFQAMVVGGGVPTLRQVKDLKMKGFSGISFISKVLMFLDPARYCVLDLQLTSLRTPVGHGAVNRLTFGTQIAITANNSAAYNAWRAECIEISTSYFGGRYRAVDVERGFFNLIQSGNMAAAQRIYEDA